MTNELDTKLSQLKELETQLNSLNELKEKVRAEVFQIIETENLDQYKNDIATISRVERKTVKFIRKPEDILADIEREQLSRYIDVIPERKELNKTFDADIKNGKFKITGVEVETKASQMIRFI